MVAQEDQVGLVMVNETLQGHRDSRESRDDDRSCPAGRGLRTIGDAAAALAQVLRAGSQGIKSSLSN